MKLNRLSIILIIVILTLTGYVVYDGVMGKGKTLSNDNCSNEKILENTNCDNKAVTDLETTTIYGKTKLNINNNSIHLDLVKYEEYFYNLELKINDVDIKVDYFNNSSKKAIFDNLRIIRLTDNLIMLLSTAGKQWNGMYATVLSVDGQILNIFEDKMIEVKEDSHEIHVVDIFYNMATCEILPDDKIVSETKIYKYENNQLIEEDTIPNISNLICD